MEKNVTCKGRCKYEIEETGKVERSCITENDEMIALLRKHGRNDGGCIKKIENDNRTEIECYCVGNNITPCNGKCVATDCKVFRKPGESEKHQHCKASCDDTKDGEKGGSPNGNQGTKDGENGGSPNGNQAGKGSTLIIIALFLVKYVVV